MAFHITVLAFSDSKHPKIYWIIPISSKYEKFNKKAEDKTKKYGHCYTIRFGTVLGRNTAVLIQNMYPTPKAYLTAYIDKNDMPLRIDNRITSNVIRNEKKVKRGLRNLLSIYYQGAFLIAPCPYDDLCPGT